MNKFIAAFILTLAVLTTARAEDVPLGTAFYTVQYVTNISSANGWNTNQSFTATNDIFAAISHSFFFTCTSNLNGAQVFIDISGEGTNFVNNYATVVFSSVGPGVVTCAYTNLVGKIDAYRFHITGTNFQGKLKSISGR